MEDGRKEGVHRLKTHECYWYQYLKELNAIRTSFKGGFLHFVHQISRLQMILEFFRGSTALVYSTMGYDLY
jgi:hypothetical protein